MQNYFIPSITAEQRKMLDAALIAWCDLNLDGLNGILLDEESFPQMLESLNLILVPEGEISTSMEGVLRVSVLPKISEKVIPANFKVKTIGWNDNDDDLPDESYVIRLAKVAEEMLPRISTDIVIHEGSGKNRSPQRDGKFHIYIWSSPSGEAHLDIPDELWGIDVTSYNDSFAPSGQGIPIIEPNSDWAVAELVGSSNLYIHHDIAEDGNEDEAEIFRHILMATIALRNLTPLQRKAHEALRASLKKISFDNWDGRNQEGVKNLVREILSPVVGKEIVINVPHGYSHSPEGGEKFYIHIWSSPSGYRSTTPPREMWEIPIYNRENSFRPSGMGIPISELGNDWIAAELVNYSDLYIHHDAVHGGVNNELAILRKIFEETAMILSATPEEREQRELIAKEARRLASRKCYLDHCMAGREKQILEIQGRIKEAQARVEKMQLQLVSTLREVYTDEHMVQLLSSSRENGIGIYEKEFDNLLTIPQVKGVESGDERIRVLTNVLYCTDPSTDIVYEIGAFQIDISLKGEVRWKNLTRQVNAYLHNMHAPHVNSEGKACLGNMEEVFPDLIARYEFATVAQLAIEFVQTVNSTERGEAWGPTITSWPVAKQEKEQHE
jgi:hypothetical protein